MRTVVVSKIRDAVSVLCLKANFELRPDILRAITTAVRREKGRAAGILKSLVENARIAKRDRIALCQDTGIVTVFVEVGQDVALMGGDVKEAIQEGVADAYERGYLRKSVVGDPLSRTNTGTNTPAIISIDIVRGSRVRLIVAPKGFGSENKSRIRMFRPTDPVDEIRRFIVTTVEEAGADACPPLVIGVGIGGTFDMAARLAKKALVVPLGTGKAAGVYTALARQLLGQINALGIGPMGLGGRTTALGVSILAHPTHIAGLPVAVNISCHATRSAEKTI